MARRRPGLAAGLALTAALAWPVASGRPASGEGTPTPVPTADAPSSRGTATPPRPSLTGDRDGRRTGRRTTVTLAASGHLSRQSEPFASARAALPARFRVHESRRWVVLSDADHAWTERQMQRLERTAHQFERAMRRLGVRPKAIRHKLVCVLFSDREAYRRFAAAEDRVTDGWVAGYYAPSTDRVVFYHGESNPSVIEARGRLAEMRDETARLTAEIRGALASGDLERADALRAHERRWRSHLVRERARVDAFADEIAVATTVHEGVHQLAFHTGIQSPAVRHPLWLSEGLATSFETDDVNRSFGPDHDGGERRRSFDELLAEDRLLELEELVAIVDVAGADADHVHVVYSQTYAFFTWCFRHRRTELRRFLELVNDNRRPLTGPRAVELFERAFGDVEKIERAWLRAERA